ncbi:MAG: MFS transporter [Phycisphaerales bacterium]|nr:MAG: MFS transporter [Phycisphaerales bacterium]
MTQRPKWFPGYTVAVASTAAFIATAPGQTFIISQLNTPLREAFGINELTLNTAYTVATVLAAFPLVYIGAMTDRLGPRRMLAIVAGLFALSCLFMSAAMGPISVFVGFFLLRFLGQGALALVSQHAVAMWFHRRLGSVHGVKQVIVFGVWILFPQGALLLIEGVGWRWTYALFALLVSATVIPLSLWLVRDRPEDMGLRMDNDAPAPPREHAPTTSPDPGADAMEHDDTPPTLFEPAFTLKQSLRTRAYWVLAAAFFLPPLIGTAFLFDIQPILALRGLDKAAAAITVSAWTATMCLMAVPAGMLVDRVKASTLVALGMGSIAASAVALMLAHNLPLAMLALGLFAVGQSLVSNCAVTTTARYFGRAHHGAIRSSLTRIGVIGTGLGPIFTGLSVHFTQGYAASMILFVTMCAPVVAASFFLRAPDRPTE